MLDGDFSHMQLYPQHLENKQIILMCQTEHEQFHVTGSKYKIKKKIHFSKTLKLYC